jgi:predicted kinase
MKKVLYIIRGLPGSGKTTLARQICPNRNFAADDYFENLARMENKRYSEVFSPESISHAHGRCIHRTKDAMQISEDPVAVHNTFSQKWEVVPYRDLCKQLGWDIMIIECQNTFGNIHDVPKDVIDRMKSRWDNEV